MNYKLEYLKQLFNITYLLEIFPLIFCLIFIKKIKQNYLRVFFVYAFFLALFISVGYCLLQNKDYIEVFQLNLRIYTLIEYLLFALFFYFIYKSRIAKILVLSSIIPVTILFVIYYIKTDKSVFDSYPSLVEFSIFLIIICYYFLENMKVVSSIPLYQKISFWLCVGLFIHFSGNFFYCLLRAYSNDKELLGQMRVVAAIVSITKDIILSLAWLAHERTETDADILRIPDGLGLDDDLPYNPTTNS